MEWGQVQGSSAAMALKVQAQKYAQHESEVQLLSVERDNKHLDEYGVVVQRVLERLYAVKDLCRVLGWGW